MKGRSGIDADPLDELARIRDNAADRNQLIHQARDAGHSLRTIARAAGLTAAGVHKITREDTMTATTTTKFYAQFDHAYFGDDHTVVITRDDDPDPIAEHPTPIYVDDDGVVNDSETPADTLARYGWRPVGEFDTCDSGLIVQVRRR